MRFSIVALLMVALSAADGAETPSIRLWQVDGLKHIVIDPDTGVVFAAGKECGCVIEVDRMLEGPVDIPYVAAKLDDSISHGRIVKGTNNIRSVWLTQPTLRYDHGVLDDEIEAGGLRSELAGGRSMEYQLGSRYFFEDLVPRLAHIDSDGLDEIVLARSSLTEGAAVSVFRVDERRIESFVVSPSIGLTYRWFNPIGATNFDADGEMDIAVVETPHLGKTLVIYGCEAPRLKTDGRARRFSSQVIGSTLSRMPAVIDLNGDGVKDIVLPDASRRRLMAVISDIDSNHIPDIIYGREDGIVEAILR